MSDPILPSRGAGAGRRRASQTTDTAKDHASAASAAATITVDTARGSTSALAMTSATPCSAATTFAERRTGSGAVNHGQTQPAATNA